METGFANPPNFVIHVQARDLYGNSKKHYGPEKAICFRCGERGHVRDQCFGFRVNMCPARTACTKKNCMHAHTKRELRTPSVERCVRVVKDKRTGVIHCIGCAGNHTFRRCPNKVCVLCNTAGHWYDECPRQTTRSADSPARQPAF